ncbi:PadR family transcriptional regulator [Streptomyces sp. NPDC046977]|uniref:PadR family transcriptional regulator n=1 Tax=Streptomyces sp. NPDC046977 TaxID=3154703 RepID=UPI0033DD5366
MPTGLLNPMLWTDTVEDIAGWIVEQEGAEFFGLQAAKATGYGHSTTYLVLRRMAHAGWLTSRPEERDERQGFGRLPRIYYRLTPQAAAEVTRLLAQIEARRRGTAVNDVEDCR